MIKADKGDVIFDGTVNTIVSEAVLIFHMIVREAVAHDPEMRSYEEMRNEMLKGMAPYQLIDAGMDPREAVEVLNMENNVNWDKSDLYPNKDEEEGK